jgi:hypothetical protein
MKEETITREHRILDEMDLNNINNTFLLIKDELKNTRIQIDSLEKNLRIQIDSLKWVLGVGFTTISLLLATVGIGLALLKVYL